MAAEEPERSEMGHRRRDRRTRVHAGDLYESEGEARTRLPESVESERCGRDRQTLCRRRNLGMPRWNFQDVKWRSRLLPTEFNHYEGALARTLGLPTLVLVQRDVRRRVVFDMSFGGTSASSIRL